MGSVLFYVLSNFGKVGVHSLFVLVVDNLNKLLQLGTDVLHMVLCAWVEEDFSKQGVIFREHTSRYFVMTLEGGAGGILMLHDGREDEGADEGHGQRVCHGFVVLVEGVFVYIEAKASVEVHEEDSSHVIALGDDDGILRA